jgi:hypothetical protein
MAPTPRPPNGVERPNGQHGRSTTTTLTDETKVPRIVADDGDGVVVDLDAARVRRLARPWPGWWGGREVASWTVAARSGCRGCA